MPPHESSVHSLPSLQSSTPEHVAPTQRSFTVQLLPSLHARAGSVVPVWSQRAIPALHTSSVQTFPSSHPSGTHAPPQHIWPVLHRFARMQVVPTQVAVSQLPGVGWHVAALQAPLTWQPACASQVAGEVQSESFGAFVQAPVTREH